MAARKGRARNLRRTTTTRCDAGHRKKDLDEKRLRGREPERTPERASSLASTLRAPCGMCVRSHIVFRNPTGKSDRRGSANLVGSAKSALCVYAVVEGPCGTLHSSRRRPRIRRGGAQDFFGPRQGLRRRHVQSIHVEAARDGRISRVIDEASRRRWRGGELLCLDKAWYWRNSHVHPTRVPPYLFGNDGGDGGAKAPPRGEALEFVEGVVCSLTGSIDDGLGPNWPRRTSCSPESSNPSQR